MFYSALEKALNYLLKLDPDTKNRLSQLEGKVIKISVTDWGMDFFLILKDQGISLVGNYQGLVDATIRGKLTGLIRVGMSGASGAALFGEGVEVLGDVELGEQIRDILRRVDIDGEEYLSRWVGDVAAHQIASTGKWAIELSKKTILGLKENLLEFSRTEAQLFPSKAKVEEFYDKVNHLRDDVERAEARLVRLEKRIHYDG